MAPIRSGQNARHIARSCDKFTAWVPIAVRTLMCKNWNELVQQNRRMISAALINVKTYSTYYLCEKTYQVNWNTRCIREHSLRLKVFHAYKKLWEHSQLSAAFLRICWLICEHICYLLAAHWQWINCCTASLGTWHEEFCLCTERSIRALSWHWRRHSHNQYHKHTCYEPQYSPQLVFNA
jgi:hypothetical protein